MAKRKVVYTAEQVAEMEQARELGTAARVAGKSPVPFHSAEIMAMVKPNSPLGTSNHIFAAYTAAWQLESSKIAWERIHTHETK